MWKQNSFCIFGLQNFILQVPAEVPGIQDRTRCRKIIYAKTYWDASKKAIEAFQNHIAAGLKKKKNIWLGRWILSVGIGMIALCKMWGCITPVQKTKCTSKPYSDPENVVAFNDTVHQGQEKVPSADGRLSKWKSFICI